MLKTRIDYYNDIIKHINFDKTRDNYCVKFYKYDNEKKLFRIGNSIVVEYKIGTPASRGAIHLGKFRDENKKLYKFAIKISSVSSKSEIENKMIDIATKAVLNQSSPHFLMSYGYGLCVVKSSIKSSFVKSNTNDSNDKKEKPIYFLNKRRRRKYYVYLNELANGDLKEFDLNVKTTKKITDNKVAQIYLSLMFFYKETGCYHCDMHNGNLLYKTVKKGIY